MKKYLPLVIASLMMVSTIEIKSQVAINTDGSAPDSSAMLDIVSTSKGILIPRVANTSDVSRPATGLMVYQTGGTAGFYYYNGASWVQISTGSYTETDPIVKAISGIVKSNGSLITAAIPSQDYAPATSGSSILKGNGSGGFANAISGTDFQAPLTLPLTITNGGTGQATANAAINALLPAQASTPGYFLKTDGSNVSWASVAGVSVGNLTESTSSVLTITGGTGAVNGLGTSIRVKQASGSQGGYLSSSDWTKFNNTSNSNQWSYADPNMYYTAGRIGIGTNSPSTSLTVERDGNSVFPVLIKNLQNTSTAHGLQIQAGPLGGDVNTNFILFSDHDGQALGYIYYDPNDLGMHFSTPSDIKLKDGITDTRFGLNDLLKIKVKDYYFKKNPSKKLVSGFIAQELYEVYPNAVIKPENDSAYWKINKEELIPLVVKSIQDQQTEIDSLKTQIKTQQATIDELLKRVEALEKK